MFKNYFILSNLLIFIILIFIGKSGPMIDLDFADWYLDKAQRISEDLKNFKIPGWDYAVMNGWNSTYSSIPINHILVILNIFFDEYTSAHLFIFLSDCIIFFGIYFANRICLANFFS